MAQNKIQIVSQKYWAFCFWEIFRRTSRIILGKYILHILFLESFSLLFLGVFCAIEYLDKVLPFSKNNREYLGDSKTNQIE
jgi:hypothetical protein